MDYRRCKKREAAAAGDPQHRAGGRRLRESTITAAAGDRLRRAAGGGRGRRAGAVRACLAAVAIVGSAGTASAQAPDEQPPLGTSPAAPSGLLVEKIENGFLIAPDLKMTRIDGGDAALAGVYGGFVTDRRLLIGAGAYWLPHGPGDVGMVYGGGLVEWFLNPDGFVDVSVRGLFGGGRATLSTTFDWPVRYAPLSWSGSRFHHGGSSRYRGGHFGGKHHAGAGGWWPDSYTYRYHQDFLIADPQISAYLNLKDWLRIGGGAGYRFIGKAGADRERLEGFTASVGMQLRFP